MFRRPPRSTPFPYTPLFRSTTARSRQRAPGAGCAVRGTCRRVDGGGAARAVAWRLAAGGPAFRLHAADRIPLGRSAQPGPLRMVVQPVGDRLAARGGRGPHPVRLSVVRFARRRRLVAAVLPGRAARRLPPASRDLAARGAAAPAP